MQWAIRAGIPEAEALDLIMSPQEEEGTEELGPSVSYGHSELRAFFWALQYGIPEDEARKLVEAPDSEHAGESAGKTEAEGADTSSVGALKEEKAPAKEKAPV